jgi:hypothetical protein
MPGICPADREFWTKSAAGRTALFVQNPAAARPPARFPAREHALHTPENQDRTDSHRRHTENSPKNETLPDRRLTTADGRGELSVQHRLGWAAHRTFQRVMNANAEYGS